MTAIRGQKPGSDQLRRQCLYNWDVASGQTLLAKVKRKPPIDKTEWDGFFDENGHLAKSRDFICVNILERGLHPTVRTEAWKFLTGYYSWQSSQDERLTVDSTRRKNYEALCQMYQKIQPLLENLHRNFIETRNNISEPRREHSCVINIGVGKNLDMLNTLINFLDPVFAEHLKGKGAGAVPSLFPWFCLCFQRAFKTFDDVWRLWEVLLTGKPCRNFQVLVAYSMLQMVRQQVLQESMTGDDILLACNNLIDLDADELISAACIVYAELIQKDIGAQGWAPRGSGEHYWLNELKDASDRPMSVHPYL
ncbi:TBC1D21 [Cervus elaphus hippelaphus]|uniref:TBC1D21 n=1 Tax=Cervus elaphus hippelaphus TaxID=46360 RepID=A0A212CUN3_CEREH|nr:TBC1D21 [Cervus elaphus hippelaphus]